MGDEEEEASLGAVRYPVMPSLVALQQMRNRLHLAQLGKKLMKWTALATGKELRRLSMEMSDLTADYAAKWKTAFLLLARARYFVPSMNGTVLESTPTKACITVSSTPRSVSGVKVRDLHLVEMGCDTHQYLGMSKGGMVIRECKEAWLELLRIIVLLCQLRTTFVMIDLANKNATKVYRILSKIIPRLINKIDETSAGLEKKKTERQSWLKVINENKIEKAIDKVLKKVVAISVAEHREQYDKNSNAGVHNNAPESFLINTDMVHQTPVIPLKSSENITQPAAKSLEKKQPITYPPKISKQELMDRGLNLVAKIMLYDDKLLLSQLGRESTKQNQKLLIMNQNLTSKEANSLNVPQLSKEKQVTAPKVNSAVKSNIKQKTQQSQQKSTQYITSLTSDALKNILCQPTPEVQLTEKEKNESKQKDDIKSAKLNIEVEETLSQQVQIIPLNDISKSEIRESVSSNVKEGIQFNEMQSKASEKKDLVVLKMPDDSDYCDDFIPPVAHKSFAINTNILMIEELDADETEEDNGEAFETGEWFETATNHSKIEMLDETEMFARIERKSNYELYSKCELPTKEMGERHLPVCDFIPRDDDYLSDLVTLIKRPKSSTGQSFSSDHTDLEKIRYLEQFCFANEYDDKITQQCSDKKQSDK